MIVHFENIIRAGKTFPTGIRYVLAQAQNTENSSFTKKMEDLEERYDKRLGKGKTIQELDMLSKIQLRFKRAEIKSTGTTTADPQAAVMMATLSEYGEALNEALAFMANAERATLQPTAPKYEPRQRFKDPPFSDKVPMDKSETKEWDGKTWHYCTKCNNPKTSKAGKWALHPTHNHKSKEELAEMRKAKREKQGIGKKRHQKYAELRESVLSRTGFVITYCNCPVTWSSKLQTEIALSTTEAEYIALSTMCRTLLPMRMLLKEINKHTVHKLQIDDSRLSTNLMNSTGEGKLVVSEIFEDNSGCIVLANDDQYRPRTKHLAIKWHHFKDQVRNGNLKVSKVDTKINWADIFTKAVDKTTFERLRNLMMGW